MNRFERSAGVVVFRIEDGKPLYMLLKHPSYWGFAKGHLEDGETEQDTALRELREESGLTEVQLVPDFRQEIEYWFKQSGDVIHKKVVFFLGYTQQEQLRLSHEHEAGAWFDFDEAYRRARYRNQRELLKKAHQRVMELIRSGEFGQSSSP